MTSRTIRSVLFVSLVLVASTGCRRFNGDKVRRDHAESYPQALAQVTEQVLAEKGALGLEDCVRLALEHSLETRSAEIQQRIAKLDRKIAFANFLPRVSVDYMHYEFDPEISLDLGGTALNIDKVRTVTWQANMSIFNPATWFLYSMRKRGAEIAELVTDYTKQMTVLQVTLLYFQSLSLEEMDQALDADLAAAVALETELRALHDEGLLSEWQADQAKVLIRARRFERDRMRRQLTESKADLLAVMGLSPLAKLTLKAERPLETPAGTLPELIVEALLCHPQLRIADRSVEIGKEQVKVAVTNFLPQLFGFVSFPDSLDDFIETSDQWMYGLSGTMTLFNGFANINEYKAARERREKSFIEREQASLAVMLEVVKAHLMLTTVTEQAELAQQVYDVTAKRLAETEQKWREGLVNSSGLLDLRAECDKARVQAINARFQHQVGTATLLNVMGKTKIDYEEPEHDGAS